MTKTRTPLMTILGKRPIIIVRRDGGFKVVAASVTGDCVIVFILYYNKSTLSEHMKRSCSVCLDGESVTSVKLGSHPSKVGKKVGFYWKMSQSAKSGPILALVRWP